jgi:protein phosphatase
MADNSESETVEELPALPPGAGTGGSSLSVEFDGRTDCGRVRPVNEDHFHIVEFGRYLRTLASSLPDGGAAEQFGDPGHAFAVADGVGGRAGGEIASRLAISLLVNYVLQTPDWILSLDDDLLGKVMDRFTQRFKAINQAVRARSESESELRGMGTTLSVAVTWDSDLLVAHIGDSRAYVLRGDRLHRLTRDHIAPRVVMDPSRENTIRIRRALTHAIGLTETGGEPDLYHYKLESGDRLLLCTDGLTDMVDEDAIAIELSRAANAFDACHTLIKLALDNGGRDNVTAVVAIFRSRAGSKPGA